MVYGVKGVFETGTVLENPGWPLTTLRWWVIGGSPWPLPSADLCLILYSRSLRGWVQTGPPWGPALVRRILLGPQAPAQL